ncbi:MAG: hypothetical protein II947_06725 [Bacteroidaceae bacterium]|nr:hypothetical protein [Bacteroidaceae bacterium]
MKTNDKLTNNSWLQRLTLFVVSLICVVGNAQATANDYYYRATASASPTAGGKVYVSKYDVTNPSYQNSPMSINGEETGYFGIAPNKTIYFYAQENSDYVFLGWKENGAGDYVSESRKFTPNKQITSTNSYNTYRTQFKYTAYFQQVKGLVRAVSTNLQRGYVQISNIDNKEGDEVTIQAFPDVSKGVIFLGWKTTQSDDAPYVTTDNPYTLTVTGSATYYAYFSNFATTVYCILKNTKTDNYLSLVGNGKATPHEITKSYSGFTRTVQDGFNFVNGLKTISNAEAVNNPLIVFKRVSVLDAGVQKGYLASDVNMKTDNIEGTISTDNLIGSDYRFIFTPSANDNNTYRISAKMKASVTVPIYGTQTAEFDSYLCENSDGSVSMKSFDNLDNAEGIDWEITFLTEDQVVGAFGANANAKYTKTKNGKYYYYTSMFTPFAYKLLDGVNAYYLNPDEDNYNEKTNTLVLTEISSGNVVPANMPVIIECNSANDPTHNRLLPIAEYTISDDERREYSKNLLVGYNLVYSRNGYSDDLNKKYQAVTNNHDYMYIFSMKNNDLGFYHYSGTTIPKNKAYLNLPHTWEEIKEDLLPNGNSNPVKLNFGHQTVDEDLNSISLFNDVVDDDADLPIYNLQGVQVMNPEKGVYIRGGKKYLVK